MEDAIDQSIAWRQAHPAFIAIQFLRSIRGLIVPLAFILVSRGLSGSLDPDGVFIWLGLAGALIVATTSFFTWQFFRFGVSDRQLRVKSGFINRQERSVSFERIQAVDIEEAPLERILGVVRVRVETAAAGEGGKADIRIEALTRSDAEDLRVYLVRARQLARGEAATAASAGEAPATADADIDGTLVRKLSSGELLLAGATSGRIGPAAAIVGFFAQFADDVVPNSWWGRLPWQDFAEVVTSLQAIFIVVFVLGVIAWILSVLSTVLSIGGFEIRRHEDQLFLRYGLLDRRRLTIPVRRMQAIRVVEGMLRQPFGLAEIRFESAGYNTETGANGVLFPLMRRSQIASFLSQVTPDFAVESLSEGVQPVPPRALPRYVVPGTATILLMAAAVIGVTWRIADEVETWSLFSLVAVPLVALYSLLEYHDAGWRLDSGRLLVRRRNGGRETLVTRVQRLQLRRLSANPFQRRARLVTFRASVASGGMGGRFEVAHIDRDDGERILASLTPRRKHRVRPVSD
jgi:putative membrane protein